MIKNYRVQFEVSPSFSINDNWLAFFYNNEFVSVANGFTYVETMGLNQFGESIKILTFDSQLEETSYQVALVNPTDTDTPLYGPFSLVDITFNYNSSFFSNVSFIGISKGNYNYQINHTLTQLQLKSLYPLASQFRIGVYKLSDGSKTNFTSVSDVNTYQNMTILSSYTDDFSFVLVANFPNGTEVDCEVYPSTFNIADATTTTTTTTEEPTTTTTTTEEQTTTTTTTESPSTYYVYDFTSLSNVNGEFSNQFGKYVTNWDGTYRIVAANLDLGTYVYYIGTDGDKYLMTFENSVSDGSNFIYITTGGVEGQITNVVGQITFDSVTTFVAGQTTTTTTTVNPNITDYSLTFRKISYGGNSPKNAPLTVNEFEGNFAYINDYINHLLGTIETLNNTIVDLEAENQSLESRITNIENGQ